MDRYDRYEVHKEVDRVVRERMSALHHARRECGMAFDGESAEAVYVAALEARGVPRQDVVMLSAPVLQKMLKTLSTPGSRSAPPMALDSSSPLASILAGVKKPLDLTR